MTFCSTPILFRKISTTATIATITATNKKSGLASICIPNFTKAPPTVFKVVIKPPNALPRSLGLMLPNVFAKALDFSAAPSKSRLMMSPLIALKLLPTCSNFDPEANTLTCSLASLSWSFNAPALSAKTVIVSGSVDSAICPLRSLSSALMAAMPLIFNGISTSFMLWLVISYLNRCVE